MKCLSYIEDAQCLKVKEKEKRADAGDVSRRPSRPAQAVTALSSDVTAKHRQHTEQARHLTA